MRVRIALGFAILFFGSAFMAAQSSTLRFEIATSLPQTSGRLIVVIAM